MAWRASAPRIFLKTADSTPQQGTFLKKHAPRGSRAREVLEEYVDAGESLWFNNYLRGLRMNDLSKAGKEELRKKTTVLNKLIRAAPVSQRSLVLFRAISQNAPALQKYARGTHADFLNKGILSTSVTYAGARDFLDDGDTCCMLVMLIPKGARMLEVLDASVWAEEGEILLPHGSIFKVMHTAVVQKVITYYCVLVLQTRTSSPTTSPPTK